MRIRVVSALALLVVAVGATPAPAAKAKQLAPAFDSAEADPGICYQTLPHLPGSCSADATADAATGAATMALHSADGRGTDAHDRFSADYVHRGAVDSLTFEAVIDVAHARLAGGGYLQASIYVSDTGCGSACTIVLDEFRTTIVSSEPGSPTLVEYATFTVRVRLSDPSGRLAAGTSSVLIDLNGSTFESFTSSAELVADMTVSSLSVTVDR